MPLRFLRIASTTPTRQVLFCSRVHRMSSLSHQPGPIETSMRAKLTTKLHEPEIVISNDSHQHRHHAAMVESGGGTETHFTVNIISEDFKGKTTMQRHRMIYAMLSDEFTQGLHALSLKTKTPAEAASRTR